MRRLRSFAGRRGGPAAAPGTSPAAAALAALAPSSAPGRHGRTALPSLAGDAGGALSLRAPGSAASRPPHPAAVSRRGGGAARGRSGASGADCGRKGEGPVFWPLRPPAPALAAVRSATAREARDFHHTPITTDSEENR
jgi:hypothetical protein